MESVCMLHRHGDNMRVHTRKSSIHPARAGKLLEKTERQPARKICTLKW